MQIPRITSYMISKHPDQAAATINRLIDAVNKLLAEKGE